MASVVRNPASGNEQSVPSTEIVRNFSVWQDKSSDRPVYILHHGRPRSVLLSLDRYSELLAGLGSQDEREERLRGQLDIVLARMETMFIQLGADLRVQRINHAAAVHLERGATELFNQPLEDVFASTHARRISGAAHKVMETGMPGRLKMKSQSHEERHYSIDIVPFPLGVALFWADVTQETDLTELRAREDAFEALLPMMTGCAIGEIRTDGMLAAVHPSLKRLLRLRVETIAETAFSDLFEEQSQRKCRLHVRHVLAGQGPACCRADIMTRDRGATRIRLFLTPKMTGTEVESVMFTILDDSLGNLPMR